MFRRGGKGGGVASAEEDGEGEDEEWEGYRETMGPLQVMMQQTRLNYVLNMYLLVKKSLH